VSARLQNSARRRPEKNEIGVVCRVLHELIIECQRRGFHQPNCIIGLQNILAAVVELTVSDENSKSARRDIVFVILGEIVAGRSNADLVIRTAPCLAAYGNAERQAAVDIGER